MKIINNKWPKSSGKKPSPSLPCTDPEPSILFVCGSLQVIHDHINECHICSLNMPRLHQSLYIQKRHGHWAMPFEFTAGILIFKIILKWTGRLCMHAAASMLHMSSPLQLQQQQATVVTHHSSSCSFVRLGAFRTLATRKLNNLRTG